ncbi:MAG: hypothetical protein R2795_23735 [Saprospiraceae bacterium]
MHYYKRDNVERKSRKKAIAVTIFIYTSLLAFFWVKDSEALGSFLPHQLQTWLGIEEAPAPTVTDVATLEIKP